MAEQASFFDRFWSNRIKLWLDLQQRTDEELQADAAGGMRISYSQGRIAVQLGLINETTFNRMVHFGVIWHYADVRGYSSDRSMSMPLIRTTFFFVGGTYGWSETYFKTDASVEVVLPKALALAIARRAILTPSFSIAGYRLSVDDVFRDAKLILSGAGVGAGQYPVSGPEESKEAFEALLCRLETADLLHRRQLYVRGVPEVISDPYGNFLQVPLFNTRATIFFDLLRLNRAIGGANPDPWQVRVPDPLQTDVQIDGLTIEAGGTFIQVQPNVAIGSAAVTVPAQLYGLRGIRSPKGASKIWRLQAVTAGPPQLLRLGPLPHPIAGAFSGTGVIRGRYLWVGSNIGNMDAVRVIRRSTGRPFSSPRGRRKGR